MRVSKKGKIVDIPIRQKTIVKLREGRTGKLTNKRAIVLGVAPASDYTRAYGREVFVCHIGKHYRDYGGTHVTRRGAGDLYPVGKAKRIPKQCREALEKYEHNYPTLARRKRRR
jgi:hypothetical protein